MFVPGIDNDITSDITTRIVYGALCDFTADMMLRYPEFAAKGKIVSVRRQVWDPVAGDWAQRTVDLPEVNSQPLLLVPSAWISKNIMLNTGGYHQRTILGYGQDINTVYAFGKSIKPTKKALLATREFRRGRDTNVSVTMDAFEETRRDLIREHKNRVDTQRRTNGIA